MNALIWAFLRRWYGGLFENKILDNRLLQSIVMIALMSFALAKEIIYYEAIFLAVWIQFEFWSRAVGEILDCGNSTTQNADSYDRWFRVPLDWVYDKIGKPKYVGYYDWWYGWLRYTLPMIVPAVMIGSWRFIVIGLLSSPVYYGSWWLFKHSPALWQLPKWIGQPKNFSEIIYGFLFGFLLIF